MEGGTNSQTGTAKLILAFRNFANASKKQETVLARLFFIISINTGRTNHFYWPINALNCIKLKS